jgi:hypothetical protein
MPPREAMMSMIGAAKSRQIEPSHANSAASSIAKIAGSQGKVIQ